MSNIFLELGSPPPLGTVIVFKLLADEIAPPEGIEGPAGGTVLWKLVASHLSQPGANTNSQLVTRVLDQWPDGFQFIFTIGGHELHSVLHTAMALCRYMGFDNPIRDMNPNDPLVAALPDLSTVLAAVPPPNGEAPGPDTSSIWSQQTGLRAPINQRGLPAPWFLSEMLGKMGAPVAAVPEEPLELSPGPMTPIALTPVKLPAAKKKPAKRATPVKKATKKRAAKAAVA